MRDAHIIQRVPNETRKTDSELKDSPLFQEAKEYVNSIKLELKAVE